MTTQDNQIMVKILNSISEIIPCQIEQSKLDTLGLERKEIGVKIEMIGDVKAVLILEGKAVSFNEIGKIMYGMDLENEMLMSFASELWNIVTGGITQSFGKEGKMVDITTPSVSQEIADGVNGYKVTLTIEGKTIEFLVYIFSTGGDK